jgi:hypothetical protein
MNTLVWMRASLNRNYVCMVEGEDHSARPREENAAMVDTLEALWPRRSSIEAIVLIEG